MKDIVDGFLRFQREVLPQRAELFKRLATSQNPRALSRGIRVRAQARRESILLPDLNRLSTQGVSR